MNDQGIIVELPRPWRVGLRLAGCALGVIAAFLVQPAVSLLLDTSGGAPGPLRLAAEVPLIWAIPLFAGLGLGVGFWIVRSWEREVGFVVVDPEGFAVHRAGDAKYVAREQIMGVFVDDGELIAVDRHSRELTRVKTESVFVPYLASAFKRLDYPWKGTADPHEHAFVAWVDGKGEFDDRAEELLRARGRALADKRTGAAEEARDGLRALGIVVRDRGGAQQCRVAGPA